MVRTGFFAPGAVNCGGEGIPLDIAHYRLSTKLGEGGMGSVYRATDTRLGREVAVKVLPDSFARDPDRLARFAREAQVLASLNHPHIAAIYGVEERALVLELVDGPTLADRIRQGPLPPEEALPLIEQLIDALEYAHEKGVVHRDLKPANIKVAAPPDGRPATLKLLDFGLAKAAENTAAMAAAAPADSPTLTIAASLPGTILGTAGYMSPEQARGGRVDHRSDIWSFGATVYEMLTAKRAFDGATTSDTLASVLKTDPDFGSVPERFRPLVKRCLERDVRRRLGWIGDARWLLEPAAPAPVRSRRQWIGATAGALAGGFAGFAASRLLPGSSGSARTPARPVRRITAEHASFAPAVSPDGKMVAYVSRRPGRRGRDIWVQQVGSGSAVRVTDDPAIMGAPVFSADGLSLLYYSERTPPGIYEAPVLGGESQLVVEGRGLGPARPSPDGKWLAYVGDGKLMVKPATGGEARALDAGSDRIAPVKLAWSPDSRRILALRFLPERRVFLPGKVPIDGGKPEDAPFLNEIIQRSFGDFNNIRVHAWLPGDEVIFNARMGDANNLFRVPLAGGAEPIPLTIAPWNNDMADVRGKWLVFANVRSTNRVWKLPADLDKGIVLGDLQPVTQDLVEAQFQDVNPAGDAVAYISRKQGGQGVYLLDLKTGADRSLFIGSKDSAYTTFSPDGTRIAYGYGGGKWPVFTVPASGGTPRQIGDAEGRIRGWSPDGRFLLVWRAMNVPGTRIAVLELATGKLTDIVAAPDGNVMHPRFAPGASHIAFVTAHEGRQRLWTAPFRGATQIPPADWTEIAEGVGHQFWSPDGRSLYYARTGDGEAEYFRRPIDPVGKPAGPATSFYRIEGYDLVPLLNTACGRKDGAYILLRGGMSDVWLTELPL